MSEILQINAANGSSISSMAASSRPRPEAKEAGAPKSGDDEQRDDATASSSTRNARHAPSTSRTNTAAQRNNGQNRTNQTSGQPSNVSQEVGDPTSQNEDDTATGKDGEQFNSILEKLMKGKAGKLSKCNAETTAQADSTLIPAVPAMNNPQTTGLTGVNPTGEQSLGTTDEVSDVLSLLGSTQNTRPQITPESNNSLLQPVSTDAAKEDDIKTLVGSAQTSNPEPSATTVGTIDPTDIKNDVESKLDPTLPQNTASSHTNTPATNTPATNTPATNTAATNNIITDDLTALEQALNGKAGMKNTSSTQVKTPTVATQTADSAADEMTITPEMLTAAVKAVNPKSTVDNIQELTPRHTKNGSSSKDTADVLSALATNAESLDINLPEITTMASNGSQLSKHDLSKDMSDDLKALTQMNPKEDDVPVSTSSTNTQPAVHEVKSAVHAEANTVSGDTGEKLAVGVAKTIDINGNKFTIMRKTDTAIEVKLEPEGIGKLDISVNVQKGVLNAHISASDATAKGIIEKNLHEIVNALTKEGLSVGGFTVSLKDRGGNYKEGKSNNGENKNTEQQRQIQPAAITAGYVKSPYRINQGISIFA